MLDFLDDRHCWPKNGKCSRCDLAIGEDDLRMCPKGTKPPEGATGKPRKWRQRTDAELKATYPICNACPHQLKEPTETLDAGVCLLKVKGCGACKSLEQFLEFKRSGKRCPDNPPRFPATELEAVA